MVAVTVYCYVGSFQAEVLTVWVGADGEERVASLCDSSI